MTRVLFTFKMTTMLFGFFQVILNAKIFLGLREVQRNLKRHKTLSESKKSRPAAFLASKCGLSKGKETITDVTNPMTVEIYLSNDEMVEKIEIFKCSSFRSKNSHEN
jgi:hypothetical protein